MPVPSVIVAYSRDVQTSLCTKSNHICLVTLPLLGMFLPRVIEWDCIIMWELLNWFHYRQCKVLSPVLMCHLYFCPLAPSITRICMYYIRVHIKDITKWSYVKSVATKPNSLSIMEQHSSFHTKHLLQVSVLMTGIFALVLTTQELPVSTLTTICNT